MRTSFTAATAGVSLLAALALTGCTSSATEPATPASSSAPAAAPVEQAAGAVVSPDTALSETQTAYLLADGTHVVVDPLQALPSTVQADIEARSAATAASTGDAMNIAGRSDNLAARSATKAEIQKGTGKRIVIAWDTLGLPFADTTSPIHFWAVDGLPGYPLIVSREDVQVEFDAFVATQEEPAEWVLVFAPMA